MAATNTPVELMLASLGSTAPIVADNTFLGEYSVAPGYNTANQVDFSIKLLRPTIIVCVRRFPKRKLHLRTNRRVSHSRPVVSRKVTDQSDRF